jgi:hypothetical protein
VSGRVGTFGSEEADPLSDTVAPASTVWVTPASAIGASDAGATTRTVTVFVAVRPAEFVTVRLKVRLAAVAGTRKVAVAAFVRVTTGSPGFKT